jgi:GcrA cell cycle regulator
MRRAEFAWTEELVQRLVALWNEGASAAEVQARIGAPSRNAVIGKVHRLRLEGVPLRGVEQSLSSVRPVSEEPWGIDDGRVAAPEPVTVPASKVDVLPGAVHLLDAMHGQCRWPLWDRDDEPKYVCGAAAEPGWSYCYAHRRIAYTGRRPALVSGEQAGFGVDHSAVPMRNRIIRPALKRAVAETARRDRLPARRRGSGS